MHIALGTADFWQKLKDDPARLAAEVCTIDVVNLDETLQHHAALRAWVNAAHEMARINEERIKWEVTKAKAIALINAKATNDPNTGKPKAVVVLGAEVDIAPTVLEATDRLHAQQEVRGTLQAMAYALGDRKDMLIQIAAKQRREMDDYR